MIFFLFVWLKQFLWHGQLTFHYGLPCPPPKRRKTFSDKVKGVFNAGFILLFWQLFAKSIVPMVVGTTITAA